LVRVSYQDRRLWVAGSFVGLDLNSQVEQNPFFPRNAHMSNGHPGRPRVPDNARLIYIKILVNLE